MKKNSFKPRSQGSAKGAPSRHSPGPKKGGGRSEQAIPRDWRIVIGTHAINEVLKVRPQQVKSLWMRQGWESSQDLRDIYDLAEKKRLNIEIKPATAIERFGSSEQGAAIFVVGAPELDFTGLEAYEKSSLLILDGIEDPHNLGAIVRTSWLANVQGVMIPEDRAVGLTPTVHKVACGGVEHVPVLATTNFSNPAEELKKQGYWIFGLSPRGRRSIFELDLPDKVIWAIGAEDKGLRVTTERLCDELVFIPQTSSSASYNASVATAMALTETLRQHARRGNQKKS